MSTTLITGLGLVGTSYAQHALKRGETVVFYDIAPRRDFLAHKLGTANVAVVQRDVRRHHGAPYLLRALQQYSLVALIDIAGEQITEHPILQTNDRRSFAKFFKRRIKHAYLYLINVPARLAVMQGDSRNC